MTGLLFIGLVALWIATVQWLVRRIARWLPDRPWRKAALFALIAALLPLPVIDEIVGGWQFHRLCSEQETIHVDEGKIRGATIYYVPEKSIEINSAAIPIRKQNWKHIYKDSGELAFQFESYHAIGGWLVRTLHLTDGRVPLLFRDSCFPTRNPAALLKSLGVTVLDHPAKNKKDN